MTRTVLRKEKDFYIFDQIDSNNIIREAIYNKFTKSYSHTTIQNVDKDYGNYIYKQLIKAGFKREVK